MCFGDGVVAGFESFAVEEWTKDRGAQQALAHGCEAGVERVEQRGSAVLAGEKRLDKLEVANGDLVELECGRVLFEFERVDVQSFIALRGAHVVEDCSGGDGGGGMFVEPESFERAHRKLPLDQRYGEVAGPHPVFYAGAGGDAFETGPGFSARLEQDFTGLGAEQLVHRLLSRGWAGEFSGAK